jgi:hypothetical protein
MMTTALGGKATKGRLEMFDKAMTSDAQFCLSHLEARDRQDERRFQQASRATAWKNMRYFWMLTLCIFIPLCFGLVAGIVLGIVFDREDVADACGGGLGGSIVLCIVALIAEYKWFSPKQAAHDPLPQMRQALLVAGSVNVEEKN